MERGSPEEPWLPVPIKPPTTLVQEQPDSRDLVAVADLIATKLRAGGITHSITGEFAGFVVGGGIDCQLVEFWVDCDSQRLLNALLPDQAIAEVNTFGPFYYLLRVLAIHSARPNMANQVQVNFCLVLPRMIVNMQPGLVMAAGHGAGALDRYSIFRPLALFTSMLFNCYDYRRYRDYSVLYWYFCRDRGILCREIVTNTNVMSLTIVVLMRAPQAARHWSRSMLDFLERRPEWVRLFRTLDVFAPELMDRMREPGVN